MAVNIIILILLIFATIKQIKIAKLQQTGGGIDKCQQASQFDRENTNLLKGILALFIMFHHLGLKTDIPVASYIFSNLGYTLTGMFFFISGYGVGTSYLNKGNDYINGFLPKRVGKILPIFLILTIIYIGLAYHIMGKNFLSQLETMSKGILPLPNSWFVLAILYFYLSFYLSCIIVKDIKYVAIVLTIFTCAYIYLTKEILNFGTQWWISYMCTVIGYLLATNPKAINYKRLLFILIALQLLFTINDKTHILTLFRSQITILQSLQVICRSIGMFTIVYSFGMPKSKLLALLGGISFEIYLTHGIPIETGVYYQFSDLLLITITIPTAIILSLSIKNYNKLTKKLFVRSA